MSMRIVQGHDLAVLPGTEWHHCRACGGAGLVDRTNPGSLASDCPTTQAQTLFLHNIFKGKLDYRRGKWVDLSARS